MNITEMLGAPVTDGATLDGLAEPKCSIPSAPEPGPEPRARRINPAWAVLAIAATLAIGFSAGTYLATPNALDPVAAENAVARPAPATVGSFAEMFTALHLSGLASASDMPALYQGEVPAAATNTWITRSATVAVESLGSDLWTTTVAVDALEMVEGAYETAGIQYFEVTVDTGGDQPVAVSPPARVPAPRVAQTSSAIPAFAVTVPPDQLTAVTAFFEAHLTGRGELARYVSATAQIPLFAEPPYESISMVATAGDSLGRVRVDLDATTARGGQHRIQYVAEMTFERGVWEVASLVPVAQDRG